MSERVPQDGEIFLKSKKFVDNWQKRAKINMTMEKCNAETRSASDVQRMGEGASPIEAQQIGHFQAACDEQDG